MREIGERWAEARSLSVGAVGVLENCAMRNEGGNGGTSCRERRSRPGYPQPPCPFLSRERLKHSDIQGPAEGARSHWKLCTGRPRRQHTDSEPRPHGLRHR